LDSKLLLIFVCLLIFLYVKFLKPLGINMRALSRGSKVGYMVG